MSRTKIIKTQCPICDVQFMVKVRLTGDVRTDKRILEDLNKQIASTLKSHIKYNKCVIVY